MAENDDNSLTPDILVVGLNPALQKRFVLSPEAKLTPGNVHRAASIQQGVGGKGQDVFITLSCLLSKESSDENKVKLAQFIGSGGEGDTVMGLLEDTKIFDKSLTIRTKSAIRTCTTIVATEDSTELVEPSGVVEAEELKSLLSKISSQAGQNNAICIMGSMPPGCSQDTYANLLKESFAKKSDSECLCLIDSVVGLEYMLQELSKQVGEAKKVTRALKINLTELIGLGKYKEDGEELSPKVRVEKIVEQFLNEYKFAEQALDYIAITDGKDPAYLIEFTQSGSDFSMYQIDIPNLSKTHPDKSKTLYPIGAGDSVASGTLAAWLELTSSFDSIMSDAVGSSLSSVLATEGNGKKMAIAFAFGLACGSASCLQEQNSVLEVDDVIELFSDMSSITSLE